MPVWMASHARSVRTSIRISVRASASPGIRAAMGASPSAADTPSSIRPSSLSSDDVSSRAVVSVLYELPFGRGHRYGGWQVNTIGAMQKGLPLILRGASNFLSDRPNSTGKSAKLDNPTRDGWFDTNQFINPPDFTYGNIGRVLPDVRTPGTVNWDLSILKNTKITERVNLQFRAEAFNFLNHVNLGSPNVSFSPGPDGKNRSGSFSLITSARDARIGQLGLKVIF